MGTRWLSIEKAVSRVLDQWVELSLHFNLLQQTCTLANVLAKMYQANNLKIYLIFPKPILKDVHRINLSFQSKYSDFTKLYNDLVVLLKSLARKIVFNMNFDVLTMPIQNYIHNSSFLGYDVEEELKKLCTEESNEIKSKCISFVAVLMDNLK